MGLGGVTVQLSGVSSASAVTDDNGQYAFTGLRMGNYSVEISGFDSDEVGFSATASAVTVGVGESKIVSFDGTYLRTAGIMGQVSVEGEGVEGVTVNLAGGPDATDMTTMTDASGQYSFAKLRAGDYAVGISGYDTDEYEFEVTSQNVTVALGETANVPFEGILLRTSGVSGRVSVEGIGLEDVMVTLSGMDMDDMTAMTDAGGLYAFAGLAAGDYTVAIALSEEQMAAYVFESTSMEVMVGDDETQIVNFEATHAATASVSGMLFIDELTKNDMYDEGEDPLPHAGVPVVLVGPGVNDQMPSATDETGAYSFMGLKAGDYQLVVPVTEPIGPFAYGGSATGYSLSVGVGEAVTQNLPIDITHTTVNFGVTLKLGDTRGMPLPGATVTLYADAMGEDKVGEGMTMVDEETGHAVASIAVAREGTSGNMVHAGVAAEGYYVAGGMTAVMWDPQKTYTQGANDNDVLNLNVDVSVNGATITTPVGGGDPLEDWVINIAHGDVVEADTLDDDGMAAFKMELPEAVLPLLPKDFTFSVVHDTAQSNSLDGGEKYESEPFVYSHTGLALAGTVDAPLEVKYTTQTLVVYTHQEKDQVAGYTGTIEGGDSRPLARVITAAGHPLRWQDPGISFELRHIDENGRSRPVPDYENRTRHPVYSSNAARNGRTIYSNVPADLNIVVKASTDADRKIINNDEAQAWTNFRANNPIGGVFGEYGGFSNLVFLCPEMAVDPDQDYTNRCSTFAYVWTRDISGEAMSESVVMAENPLDGFDVDTTYHSGIQVALNPVARKNVQADNFGATTSAEQNAAGRQLGKYSIANVGDGDYELSASGGFWDVTTGYKSYRTNESVVGGVPPRPVAINVVPFSFDAYGTVVDMDGVGIQDVEVTLGGETVTTDDYGRYIIADATPGRNRRITVAKAGYAVALANGNPRTAHARANGYTLQFTHWPNTPGRKEFVLRKVTPTGTVSGTIKHLQSDEPLEGVRVFALKLGEEAPADLSMPGLLQVDRDADGDPVFTFDGVEFADVDTTDADGMFSVDAPAGALDGQTTTIVAYRSGMFFMPATHITTVLDGGAYTISFDGLRLSAIDGYIVDGAGNGMGGVTVTAVGGSTGTGVTRVATTLASGRYNIRVPWGPYTVTPMKEAYSFEPENLAVTLAAEQVQTLQNFEVSADDNASPVFSSPAAFSAAENQTAIGTVVATDADDNIRGYAITGGADMDKLSIDLNSGVLTFNAAPDFEMPGDADGMNDYSVEVTAASGTGARLRTAMQEITVTVTDVDEPVADPQVTLVLAPASISENGGVSVVTATVAPAADAAFEVTVTTDPATSDGFMRSGSTLFFAAGATTATASATSVPVTITAVNDNAYTGDKKVMVMGSVTEASGVMKPADVELTIMDDDEASVVSLVLSRPSIREADPDATDDVDEAASGLTATLNRAHNAELMITVATDPAAGPFTLTATTLTIPAGAMSSSDSIVIEATPDDTDELNHAVTISGTAAPAQGVMGPAPVTLPIMDDDDAPGAISDLAAVAAAPTAGVTQVDVTLTWTAPTPGMLNGEAATVEYQYRTKTSGQTSYDAWQSITPTPGAGATVQSTVNNTHQYQVRAVIPNGPEGPASGVAQVVIPPAPTE